MRLKDFQKRVLTELQEYFEEARLCGDPETAFLKVVRPADGRVPTYRRIEGLENIPYVCLRLPTGGGKTIVGAHAIRVAARSYIEKDFPVVLWLVPTNTIRSQTADALKNPTHPYRIALDDAFERRVRVYDISEIENIRPQDLIDGVCVVVGTIQTLRVERTEGRDVYAHKEALEPHFAKVNPNLAGLERIEEGPNRGKLKYSFANLMAVHRPMVIMDEAHNARTHLSFEALRRVSPSCIVELTATPDTDRQSGSNVLCRVSASELKAEEMIKLPIVLTVHPDGWEAALSDALRTRTRLAELAAQETEYLRPILLVQAENRDRPANVDAVKQFLIESEQLAESKIAIATGDQRELDDINLFDPGCQIDVVITVQALKEGWDCSFAYVFCSTANISNSRDVEQLLGRVLRMPYARRRAATELNKAYAHVSSPQFAETAKQLESSMIAMGFDDAEVRENIELSQPSIPGLPLFLQKQPFTFPVAQPPDLQQLTPAQREMLIVQKNEGGNSVIEYHGEVTPQVKSVLLAAVSEPRRTEAERLLDDYANARQEQQSPAQHGERLRLPRLSVEYQGELELVDRELLLDAASWNLLESRPDLSDFQFHDASKTFEFDVVAGHVRYKFKGEQELNLDLLPSEWTETDFVRWLDKQLRQPDVRQEVLQEWLRLALSQILEGGRFTLAAIVRAKFILTRKLVDLIGKCRSEALKRGFQQLLFAPDAPVKTSFDYEFTFDPNVYPATWSYSGGYRFTKHFYGPNPGELKSDGEEFDCAQALDIQSCVKHWVRNLSKPSVPNASFWLPTSTDRFYPDFVAELLDGRLLVVEYKGAMLAEHSDTKEKAMVGELWERKSEGKALFLIVEQRDKSGRSMEEQIRKKISPR